MIFTLAQDKILREYTTQINDEKFKISSENIPDDAQKILLDLDESNIILYEKHLIVNIDVLRR